MLDSIRSGQVKLKKARVEERKPPEREILEALDHIHSPSTCRSRVDLGKS